MTYEIPATYDREGSIHPRNMPYDSYGKIPFRPDVDVPHKNEEEEDETNGKKPNRAPILPPIIRYPIVPRIHR